MKTMRRSIFRRSGYVFRGGFAVFAWLLIAAVVFSWQPGRSSAAEPVGAGGNAAPGAKIGRSVTELVEFENAELDRLKAQSRQLQESHFSLKEEISTYKVKLPSYNNLLLIAGIPLKELDKALSEIHSMTGWLKERRDAAVLDLHGIEALIDGLPDQLALYEQQRRDLRETSGRAGVSPEMAGEIKALQAMVKEKQRIAGGMRALFSDQKDMLQDLLVSLTDLSGRLEKKRGEQRASSIFERKPIFASGDGAGQVQETWDQLSAFVGRLASPSFWRAETRELRQSVGTDIVAYLFLYLLFILFLVRLRKILEQLTVRAFFQQNIWCATSVLLLTRTLLFTGTTLFLYLCTRVDALRNATPSLQAFFLLLWISLVTRWGLDLSGGLAQMAALPLPHRFQKLFRSLMKLIRLYGWAYIILQIDFEPAAPLMITLRLFFGMHLLILVHTSLRARNAEVIGIQGDADTEARRKSKEVWFWYPGYIVAALGMFLDFMGYGVLSAIWYAAWGRMLFLVFVNILILHAFGEWNRDIREKRKASEAMQESPSPAPWLLLRLAQMIWFLVTALLLVWAWGGGHAILAKLFGVINRPYQLGNLTFRFMGFAYAVLALFVTHTITRLWGYIFETRFLTDSGLDVGLKESIKSISNYLIWGLGILFSLHLFGLNSTSLAVAFGALGIGLGFGLQAIFNNFMSGIILLFERPIQVGDDVEVNGIWATVKKINVRATVVQTYDNASLIIPNSEFISSQVTNWSFKDKRLRRKITVGVAYGSDIELVRKTLLEIAAQTPGILKRPHPDVLFTDFGDSALIFVLRVWMVIENMFQVETAVRFSIDRLFRERGIEIAFPQRDIHIRTIASPTEVVETSADTREEDEEKPPIG